MNFPQKESQPSEEHCYAKVRQLMTLADEAPSIEAKAKLLGEAGEWLHRAEKQRRKI